MKIYKQIVTVEIMKLGRTFALWLTILYPAGTVSLVTLLWISMRNNKNAGSDIFINNLGNTASFFLPFFIVLLISVACNTEHRSAMLKHLLSLPVPRPLLYLGKFTGIMFFVLIALLFTIALAYFSLLLSGVVNPRLGFGESFNHLLLILKLLKAYLAAAAIYSIQYWLGMRLRNLTLPVALGSALIILPIAVLIILGITGLISSPENFDKIISYNPYSYPYSSALNFSKPVEMEVLPTLTLLYIVLSVTSLVLGAWEFNRRNII